MNWNIRSSLEPKGSLDFKLISVKILKVCFLQHNSQKKNPQRALWLLLLRCTLVRHTELRPWTWDRVIHSRQQRHHAIQNISPSVAMENGRTSFKQRHEHRAIHLTRDTKSTSITINHKWPLTCPHSCTQGGSSPFSWWQWKHLTSRSQ